MTTRDQEPAPGELRRLLLHRLTQQEAERLEELLLLRDDVADQLREAEHDLLDDYAAGRLGAAERADVEKYLLATEADRMRLRVARALTKTPAPRRRPGWFAPAGALLAAGVAFLLIRPLWQPSGLETPQVLAKPPATAPVSKVPASPPAAQLTSSAPAVVLLAERQRSAVSQAVKIPQDASQIRLQLEIPGSQTVGQYRIAIADGGGRQLFAAENLLPAMAGPYHYVETLVPRAALGFGARQIALQSLIGRTAMPLFTWRIDTTPQ